MSQFRRNWELKVVSLLLSLLLWLVFHYNRPAKKPSRSARPPRPAAAAPVGTPAAAAQPGAPR